MSMTEEMEEIRNAWETLVAVRGFWETIKEIGTTVIQLVNSKQRINEEIRNLDEKVSELRRTKLYISQNIGEQERPRTRKRKREVSDWLREVRTKINEAEERLRTVEASGYISRWRLREAVQKDIRELTELDNQGREFNNDLCTDVGLPKGVEFLVPSLLESAKQKSDTILEYLKGDQIRKIGVCGMVGVGKTTIAYYINNRLLADDSFDYVFFVNVPAKSSTYRLQNLIAEAAGLALCDKEKSKRASMLHEWLRSKKFVLILDSISKPFSLREVGIPLDTNRRMILTTRDAGVCAKMDCQLVEVELLSAEESLDLFLRELGSTEVLPQHMEYAMSVVESCDRVALAIVSVAISMRGTKSGSEWRNASLRLNQLERSLFEKLKFCYSRLDDENQQHCLLYCALFPKGHEIERNELIAYWIGEELIPKETERWKEFDHGKHIIRSLTDARFLETRKHMNGRSFIKMHDAVWKMALTVASLEQRKFMVKAGMNLKEFPGREEWLKALYRVSLMRNDLEETNIWSPDSPELKTLLLQHNKKLRKISPNFFGNFQKLYVLDLSYSSIETLPNIIINLDELRVLILRRCQSLRRIPSLRGKLKKLLELDLGFTGLRAIPRGIESLENLRVLDLSWTCLGTLISSPVLRGLALLQSLRLGGCKVQEEAVTHLQCLETLHMDFSNIQSFTSYLETPQFQKLQQYCFVCRISENTSRIDAPYENLRTVILSMGSGWESTGSLLLPANMQQLQIDACSNITGLLQRLQLQSFDNLRSLTFTRCQQEGHLFCSVLAGDVLLRLRNLKLLQVCDCSNLEEIFYQYDHTRVALPRRLVLRYLPKLTSIYSGIIHSVEEIEVVGCPELKRLPFSRNEQVGGEAGNHSLKKILGKKEWWDSLLWDTPDLRDFMEGLFCESNA